MAPPPSQAGKFKPRKPAKKIRVGAASSSPASASAALPPQAVPSSAAAAAAAAGGRGGRGRGGRGGGRGGRGGVVQPQGQVFFTAQPAPAGSSRRSAAASRKSAAASTSSATKKSATAAASQNAAIKQQPATASVQEEIVGTLEEAVGSIVPNTVQSLSSKLAKSASKESSSALERALLQEDDGYALPMEGGDGYYYESDSSSSSEDGDVKMADISSSARAPEFKQPLTLPFPTNQQEKRPSSESTQKVGTSTTTSTSLNPPFASAQDKEALQKERDSWFLVQLPTRLPAIRQQKEEEENAEDEDVKVITTESMVSTAPMKLNAFDNSLSNAVSGHLGKIKIYKSGKTVLVMNDGTVMNLTQGLNCSFQQQAVAIDAKKEGGQYVRLGAVDKTIVATPQLTKAFESSSSS